MQPWSEQKRAQSRSDSVRYAKEHVGNIDIEAARNHLSLHQLPMQLFYKFIFDCKHLYAADSPRCIHSPTLAYVKCKQPATESCAVFRVALFIGTSRPLSAIDEWLCTQ